MGLLLSWQSMIRSTETTLCDSYGNIKMCVHSTTGAFGPSNTYVNNFTNPNGDRFDTGNNFGQLGSVAHVNVNGTHGVVSVDGAAIGLTIPAGMCDSTYQVRAFATDGQGRIIGVAVNPSVLSYSDFSRPGCTP
jgi:hypothetical protein